MAKIDDAGFIALWRRLGSPELVSKETGIGVRSVYSRRDRIEQRYGITLPSAFNDRTGRLGAEGNLPKKGIRRILNMTGTAIIFSDAHVWPDIITPAMRALYTLTEELQPNLLVCNGDLFDGARISRHDPVGWEDRAYPLPKVKDEIAACKAFVGGLLGKARRAKYKVWNLGNHDIRLPRYLAMNAGEVEGLEGVAIDDHIKGFDLGWSLMVNGHTMIKHRWHGGVHATYNNTLKAGTNIVTGHLHQCKVTPHTDYNGRRWGVDCGTLLDIGPETPQTFYAEDNPQPHGSGFAVLTFDKNGMLLPPELCEVINGHAYFRGGRV